MANVIKDDSVPLLPDSLERLVIVLPSWVGDAVMATPVLRALRNALPNAHLTGVMRGGLDELLAGSPWLDETIVHRNAGLRGPARLAREIRRRRPQAGVLLPNSFRSALSLRLSGCPVRIGYGRDGRSWLLSAPVAPPPRKQPIPAVEYYIHLAERSLGANNLDRKLELHTTESEQAAANELLRGVAGSFVVLNPGANKPGKRWSPESFATIGDTLAESEQVTIAVNGSPAESEIIQAVITASKDPSRFINLVERGVRLGSLKAVLQRASLLITNDTGPRHIAAAMGTPAVSLFGPTDHRWTTLPCVREMRLLAEPFLPEEAVADEHVDTCRIDRIRRADVVFAAIALLRSA